MTAKNGSSNTRKTTCTNGTDDADSSVASPPEEAQESGISAEADLNIAPLETVMRILATDVTQGLSTAEAEERHALMAAMSSPHRIRSLVEKIVEQLRRDGNILLIAWWFPARRRVRRGEVIAAIVILNAALGIYQEGRAENAIASL